MSKLQRYYINDYDLHTLNGEEDIAVILHTDALKLEAEHEAEQKEKDDWIAGEDGRKELLTKTLQGVSDALGLEWSETWLDLGAKVTALKAEHEAEMARLRGLLQTAHDAIQTLPADCFGVASDGLGEYASNWYIRAQMLSNFQAELSEGE